MFTPLQPTEESFKKFTPILCNRFGFNGLSTLFPCEKGIMFSAMVGKNARMYLYSKHGELIDIGALPLPNVEPKCYGDESTVLCMQEDDTGVCIYTAYKYPTDDKKAPIKQWVTFSSPKVFNHPDPKGVSYMDLAVAPYYSITMQEEYPDCLYVGDRGGNDCLYTGNVLRR